MGIEQTLQKEIEESKRWVDTDEGVYKRDLSKRIELITWALDKMKNQSTPICEIIEIKMNDIIDKINKTHSTLEADPLDSELRILDWIFISGIRFVVNRIELENMKN